MKAIEFSRTLGRVPGARPFALLLGIIVACVFGPSLVTGTTGWRYTDIPDDKELIQSSPPLRTLDGELSVLHLLGTDNLGRDLLSRVLVGGRVSLAVALLGSMISLLIALVYGCTAGYLGGRVDVVMVKMLDGLSAIPYLILCIAALGLIRPKTQVSQLAVLIMVLAGVSWISLARIIRDLVRSTLATDYVLAARALGCTGSSIIFRHVLPNTAGVIISYTCLTIPVILLTESFLSFLGLGVQPPLTSWGALIGEGVQNIAVFPWQLLIPAVAMIFTSITVSFAGEALRLVWEPTRAGGARTEALLKNAEH